MLSLKLLVFLFFIILVDSGKPSSRHNSSSLKKESHARVGKRPIRSEVLEDLFNVYDPSFLALVWPKITNGLHILVDYSCWEDLGVFFRDLTEGRPWVYRAVDASGRYESGLFSGNRFWLGSKKQCLLLDQEAIENNVTSGKEFSRNKYFDDESNDWMWRERQGGVTHKVLVTDRWPPYRLAYTALNIFLNITKTDMIKSYDITLGVCLPRSCSPRDITSIINFSIMINDNLKTNKTISRTVKIITARQVPGYYNLEEDSGAILLICITVLLSALAISATVVDLHIIKCLPYGKQSKTFDLEKYNGDTNKSVEEDKQEINNEIDKLGMENTNKNIAVDNMMKSTATVIKDVQCAEKSTSCSRCGKYRKHPPLPQNSSRPCPRLQYDSIASLSTESKKRNISSRLLLCFSISYCFKRIFNTNIANKDLSLIHGIRILATFWIIFLHVAVLVDYISDTASDINELNNIYYIIATGTIAFDTLFFVSSHHFFYLKSQYSVQELVGWSGICGQVLQFICFVTNRVIRLLPSYGYVLLLSAVVARWSRSTDPLALPDRDNITCNKYWWRNMLYVSNMYPKDEQCMQISWYLSTETQVHMFGALLCAISARSRTRARISIAIALVAVLSATVADASVMYFDFRQIFSNGFDVYTTIIERPWARFAPYFIGVFTGWLVHITQGNLKVSKVTSSLLWVSSISFIIVSMAVSFVGLPWLAAWLHLSWPIALLWPVLMGTTNLAGAFRHILARSPVAALSRLCYGMILLHPVVSRAVLLSLETSLCSETTCIWLYFAGTALLTLLASFILCLLVEMPFCSLFRRISDYAT